MTMLGRQSARNISKCFQIFDRGIHVMYQKENLDNAWIAVQTRILHEKKAAEHLALHGYVCFVPLQYKKEYKTVPAPKHDNGRSSIPLFPGYLFCRYKLQNNFPIVRAPGVIRLLCYGDTPAAIPENEVEFLQRVALSGLWTEPYQFFQSGQKVRINSGPCRGVEGYIVEVTKNDMCRIAVKVSVVEKSVLVNMHTTEFCAI
jgi:transcription antitermination factor NusG